MAERPSIHGAVWFEVPLFIVADDEVPVPDDKGARIGFAVLTLGWRKRVAEMRLTISRIVGPGKESPELSEDDVAGTYFQQSDSTKGISKNAIYIHAWPGNNDEQRRKILVSFAQIVQRRFPKARFRKEFPRLEGPVEADPDNTASSIIVPP